MNIIIFLICILVIYMIVSNIYEYYDNYDNMMISGIVTGPVYANPDYISGLGWIN